MENQENSLLMSSPVYKFISFFSKKPEKRAKMKRNLKEKTERLINITQFKINETLDGWRDYINQKDE